jgi:agmatinase
VLHFDAHLDTHLDTWDTYFGAPYTHGTPFRRASEEGLLDRERCLHVGTRGPLYAEEDLTEDGVLGFQVIGTDDYQLDGVASVNGLIADALTPGRTAPARTRPSGC